MAAKSKTKSPATPTSPATPASPASRKSLAPLELDCRGWQPQKLAELEWLVANSLGSYASGSVLGANTRRYHGLLVSATMPPVGRQVLLSALREEVYIGDKHYDLSCFMFPDTVSPNGHRHLVKFINNPAPTWIYDLDGVSLQRQVVLSETSDIVAIRYHCDHDQPVKVHAWPFGAIRDFHDLRRRNQSEMLTFAITGQGVTIEERQQQSPPLWVGSPNGEFHEEHQWWFRFQYIRDLQRGQEGLEDIPTPGYIAMNLSSGKWTELFASTQQTDGFDTEKCLKSRAKHADDLAASVGRDADELTRRLAVASEIFTVQRQTSSGPSKTILAGYHWFADWGRDTFIALPGLLLGTRRFDSARAVLDTFSHAISKGMIPNRFDDYGGKPHYNSMDASLWFVVAVDRYIKASGDEDSWRQEFAGAVQAIVDHYHDGTRFGIHADSDGLVCGGSDETQLSWMDVKFNGEAITPRHGKPVEINALWIESLNILASRLKTGPDADRYAVMAANTAREFVNKFWFDEGGYLYDCVSDEGGDTSLRPNQLIAASMASIPLTKQQRQSIVDIAAGKLLTPRGLRTISPDDPRYRSRYGGSWESRDRSYHQGTVWAWLMGPFIQAHLLAHDFSDDARKQANGWLAPFGEHMHEAALGQVNEIFDGAAPHTPRGCVAQAWSVSELLRAKLMVQTGSIC